ncbi:MAG: FliM/FliN family flagellar motor switch protein [Hyphomonas sp.]
MPPETSHPHAPRPAAAEEGWDVSPRLRRRIMADMPPPRPPIDPDRRIPTARGILSPAEIEMLLRPDLSDMDDLPVAEPEVRRVPELKPETSADSAREDAARRIAARLSRAMREHCGLAAAFTIKRISPVSLAGAVSAREERGQAIVCFAGADGDVPALFVIGAGLAQLMIETACGGPVPINQPKPMSPIDLALIEGLARPIAPAVGAGLCFAGVETDPLFAASLAAPGAGLEITFSVRAGGADWPARLILSEALLADKPGQGRTVPDTGNTPAALTVLMTARAASVDMPLSKLTRLRPGATLLLGVPADQPVELLSGGPDGTLAAEGQIGRKGNRMAIRITRRGPALRALNPAHSG